VQFFFDSIRNWVIHRAFKEHFEGVNWMRKNEFDDFTNGISQMSNRTTYSEISTKDSPYGKFSQYTEMNPYDAMYNADGTPNVNLAWDLNNPLYEAS
jgi:hypothetical protein